MKMPPERFFLIHEAADLSSLSPNLMNKLVSLVIAGGQVTNSPDWVRVELLGAHLLGICYGDGKEPIGVAAIKSRKSGDVETELQNHYDYIIPKGELRLEFGSAATKKEFEGDGICRTLTNMLFEKVGSAPLYAVTRVKSMMGMLCRRGFEKVGTPYLSSFFPDKAELELFVRL